MIAAARELGHLGISSFARNPGPVPIGWMDDKIRATLTAMQPASRLGAPDETAKVVRFLESPTG